MKNIFFMLLLGLAPCVQAQEMVFPIKARDANDCDYQCRKIKGFRCEIMAEDFACVGNPQRSSGSHRDVASELKAIMGREKHGVERTREDAKRNQFGEKDVEETKDQKSNGLSNGHKGQ